VRDVPGVAVRVDDRDVPPVVRVPGHPHSAHSSSPATLCWGVCGHSAADRPMGTAGELRQVLRHRETVAR
jgi:hypothetical protein